MARLRFRVPGATATDNYTIPGRCSEKKTTSFDVPGVTITDVYSATRRRFATMISRISAVRQAAARWILVLASG